MDSFYVYLPSSSPILGNKQSKFVVRLSDTIDLSEGEWTVSLASISYPMSFTGEFDEELWVEIQFYEYVPGTLTKTATFKYIPKLIELSKQKIFDSVDDLQDTVNNSIDTLQLPIKKEKRQTPEEKKDTTTTPSPETRSSLEEVAKVTGGGGGGGGSEQDDDEKLKAAFREVKERSNKTRMSIYNELSQVGDRGTGFGARVIYEISYVIIPKLKVHEDFSKYELNEINIVLSNILIKTNKAKENLDANVVKLNDANSEYHQLLVDFENHYQQRLVELCRKDAQKAKQIVTTMEGLKKVLNDDAQTINDNYRQLEEKKESILNELMVPLDEGTKNNIKRVVDEIKKKLGTRYNNELKVYFYYDSVQGKFFVYNHNPEKIRRIKMSPALAYKLGFTLDNEGYIKHIRFVHGGGYAKYTPDISTGIRQIFVYMPGIIQPCHVGDRMAPVLRVISIQKTTINTKDTQAEHTSNPEYHHRVTEKRHPYQIELRSHTGNLLNFNWGEVLITLHFQRRFF